MMSNKDALTEELLGIRKEIEDVKLARAQLQGKIETLNAALKKHASTTKGATQKLKDLQKEIDKIDKEIEKGMITLEDEYGF